MLEKIFKLKENNTTARTEIIAGLTTFLPMAYIIALNPNLLTGFGKDSMPELWNGVFLATCIASAIGTIVMAFLANKPPALAPGPGLPRLPAAAGAAYLALDQRITQSRLTAAQHGPRLAVRNFHLHRSGTDGLASVNALQQLRHARPEHHNVVHTDAHRGAGGHNFIAHGKSSFITP